LEDLDLGTIDSAQRIGGDFGGGGHHGWAAIAGMRLDLADALAQSVGVYTTPETADGNSPTITNPGDWTVCSQQHAAGTTTTSNGGSCHPSLR
jgi:hypothetical protein